VKGMGEDMQTEEDLYSLFKVRRDQGATWKMIASETNLTLRQAESLWSKMRKRDRKVEEQDGPSCLRCAKGFKPLSKFQKLCPRCRALPGWMAA